MIRHYSQALCSLGLLSTTWVAAQTETSPPPVVFSEISRKVVQLEDRKVTYVRIRPPLLPPPPAESAPAATPIVSAEEQAAADRLAAKAFVSLGVGANVYYGENQRPVSELQWCDEQGNQHVAWSTVDFRYLTQLHDFESSTTVYQWFPMVTPLDLGNTGASAPIPAGLELSPTEVEYHVSAEAKSDAAQETMLNGLDLIHAYYQLHYQDLKIAYEELQARVAEEERQRVLNPPKPQNATIHFWKIAAPSAVTNE